MHSGLQQGCELQSFGVNRNAGNQLERRHAGNDRHSLECVVLPIELVSFTATAMTDRVRTEWITASESNNDYFTLERSADGSTFESIGTVHSMGDSQQQHRYIFDDPDPLRIRA